MHVGIATGATRDGARPMISLILTEAGEAIGRMSAGQLPEKSSEMQVVHLTIDQARTLSQAIAQAANQSIAQRLQRGER